MKRMLLAFMFLSLNLSSFASSNGNDGEKKRKILCQISMLFLPATLLAGPDAAKSAFATWAQCCVKPKGTSSTVTVVKKEW